ncbi:MAG: FkbM family methyltransferase [Thermoanaerobaculia bacterium]
MIEWLRRGISAILRLPLRLVPRDAIVRILSGELRGWRWIAGSSTNGCWLGNYERHVQRLFRQRLHAGAVVLDIGANVGFFTLLASRMVGSAGHVYAFEPLPRNLRFLERHIQLNEVTNVSVEALAIAAASGEARFQIAPHASMGSLSDGGELQVETASLDDLLGEHRIATPQFIKMDIEGAEGEALRGAAKLLAHRPLTIVLSTHGFAQHELCWKILQRTGFQLDLLRDGITDGDYLILATK